MVISMLMISLGFKEFPDNDLETNFDNPCQHGDFGELHRTEYLDLLRE